MSSSTPDPRRWRALALIAVAQFMVIMDTSIIGVALPGIQQALGFSSSGLSWVFNAYVVAFGGLLLLGGRLADLFGARRIFVIGFMVLGAGSLLAGMAVSDSLLLIGRAVQGMGSALIAPAALSLLMTLFAHDPRELTRALALYGAAAPAGGTAGVFLGGLLTAAFDWRLVFLVNVPVALAVVVGARGTLPLAVRRPGRLDLAGALSVTAALSLAVFALAQAPASGWAATATIVPLGLAILLFAGFLLIEARRQDPLMRLSIWRAPNLAAGNTVMALLGAAWIPTWFFLNLYLQQVLVLGAFEAGLALLPMTLAIMILMVAVTGRIVARVGPRRPLVAGLALLAAGIGWLALAPGEAAFATAILPATLVAAGGMSLAYIPAMLTSLSGARPEEGGLAAGIVNTTYQGGSAIGLAAVTAVAVGVGGSTGTDFPVAFMAASTVAVAAAVVASRAIRPASAPAEAADTERLRSAA